MRTRLGRTALLCSLLVVLPASAALGAGAGGFYLAAGVGSAEVDDDRPGLQVDDSDTVVQALLGFELFENVAVEGGFVDLGDFAANGGATLAIDGVVLGGRVQLPVGPGFFVQARAGALLWDTQTTLRFPNSSTRLRADGEDLYYGIGGRWAFAKAWAASLDYTRFETADFDVDHVGATLYYSFDL